uniref:Transmembrane protein 150A n=1 Tax=Oreochromis niloticus TaxID=8128 RepID=A0A669DWW6_ORENI
MCVLLVENIIRAWTDVSVVGCDNTFKCCSTASEAELWTCFESKASVISRPYPDSMIESSSFYLCLFNRLFRSLTKDFLLLCLHRYAMALYNQHVCPVNNCKCGTLPPESCFFSLICSTGSFMVMLIGLLRYAHVIEKHQNCILNTAGLSTGWLCAAGLIMVGNFQVDFAKVLHYVGAGVAFPSSMLFVCLQSALTYRLAKTQEEYWIGHIRVGMALLALIALVLSGVFFCQESFALQHASAIFEWIYCSIIMFFYGTFAFEFGGMSGDTLMVLSKGGAMQSFSTSEHKTEVGGGTGHHQPEGLSIL